MKPASKKAKVTSITKSKTLSHEQRSRIAKLAAAKAWRTMKSKAYLRSHSKQRKAA